MSHELRLHRDPWILRFGVFLFLLQLAIWPQVIAGRKSLCFRDYGLFGFPLAEFHRTAFWEGRLPLWNPYNECGVPFLAQWNTLALYPGSLIYLFGPLPWSLDWYCLAHQWLAGMGMFVLCRRWIGGTVGPLVAGVGYAFGGLTMSCVFWPNNIAALGWMPWVILLLPKAIESKHTPSRPPIREPCISRSAWLLPAVATLQMLCGAPEITLMTWIVGASASLAFLPPPHWLAGLAKIVGFFACTLVLCAVQLLPFFHFLGLSQRDAQFSAGEWSIPALGAVNFFLPWFQSYQSIHGLPLQYGQYWIPTYYAGVFIVGGAILSFFTRTPTTTPRLTLIALAAGSVLMAMGDEGHLYRWVRTAFPQLGVMRFPVKWLVITAFSLPVLAATGLNALFQMEPRPARNRVVGLAIIGVSLLALFAWIDVLTPLGVSALPHAKVITHAALVHGLALLAALAILAWLLRARHADQKQTPAFLAGLTLLGLITATELAHAFPQVGTLVNGEVFQPASKPDPDFPRLGEGRVMLGRETIRSFMRVHLDDPTANYLLKRAGAFANANLLDRIPKVDGFFSMSTKASSEITDALFARLDPSQLPLTRFLTVTHWSREPLRWVPLKSRAPGAWLGSVETLHPAQNLEQVLRPDWQPEREAWIESAWTPPPSPLSPRIEWSQTQFSNESIRAQATVPGTAPGFATLAVSWHPGWIARINGNTAKIWKINHAFMGLEIPPGTHLVEFEYREPWLAAGAFLSVTGLGLWLFGLVRALTKLRTNIRPSALHPPVTPSAPGP